MNRKGMYYFKGWMSSNKMNEEWLNHWRRVAQDADANEEELILFKVPKHSQIIEDIDRFIQEQLVERNL